MNRFPLIDCELILRNDKIRTASATLITLTDVEREHIMAALAATGWVGGGVKGAAARLGMKRSTLQKKMQKLGISRPA